MTYDRSKLTITRHRRSATQGEVSLTYDGRLLGRYGDYYNLTAFGWLGRNDDYWHDAAKAILARKSA